MRSRLAIGSACVALGVCAAIACSSTPSDPLAGGTSSSGGGSDVDACVPMGTAVSDGQGYVSAEACPSCHGADMSGSSVPLVTGQEQGLVIRQGDYLYPPNLTPDMTTGIGSWTDGQIRQAISQGIDNNSEELCPEMGEHYPNLCYDEVTGIIAYLRSLPPVVKKDPGSICPPLKQGTPPSSSPSDSGGPG